MATDVTRQGLGRSRPRYSSYAGLEPGGHRGHHGLPHHRLRGDGLTQRDAAETLERNLGWFSIGFGAAAVAAPRLVGWLNGLRSPALMRLVGTRELTAGIGILTQRDRAPWLWTRVIGDTFDLAALSIALARRGRRGRAAAALAAVAAVTALDLLAAMRFTGSRPCGAVMKAKVRIPADVPTLQPDKMEETGRTLR